MRRLARSAVLLCLCGIAGGAPAAIFVQNDGTTGIPIFSNVPARGQRVAGVGAAPAARTRPAAASDATAFPRVSVAQQQERDVGRRTILLEELDSEIALFQKAKAASAAPDVQARHDSNIAALKRELNATR